MNTGTSDEPEACNLARSRYAGLPALSDSVPLQLVVAGSGTAAAPSVVRV